MTIHRDFFRFHFLTTEKRRCGSRQRVAASELDVGTMGELSGVADLLVDVETSRISPHADAPQSFRAPPRRISPLASGAAPRRAKEIGNLGVGLRAAYDVQGTGVGHGIVPVALRHRSCDPQPAAPLVRRLLPSVQLADVDVHRRHDAGLTGDELSPSRRLLVARVAQFPKPAGAVSNLFCGQEMPLWWWHFETASRFYSILWNVVSYPPARISVR